MEHKGLRRLAWAVLGYTVLVVMWGAGVRATGSGAGCGSHWPLCNGEVLPREPQLETLIELSHRLTSGLCGVFVLVLLVAALRTLPRHHPGRLGAGLSFFFVLVEAGVGAGLVKFELVADNTSHVRGLVMAIHLMTTFLFLGALTFCAFWCSGGRRLRLTGEGRRPLAFAGGVLFMFVVGVSGAITALGDTLFPAESLRAGLEADFSPTAHLFVRLRIWHPPLAIGSAAYLGWLGWTAREDAATALRPSRTRALATLLLCAVAGQIVIGISNFLLRAPVPLQLVHLLVADLIWIFLLLLAAEHLQERTEAT